MFSTQVQQLVLLSFLIGSGTNLIFREWSCLQIIRKFLCAFPIIEKVLTLFYFKTEQALFDHQIYKTRLFSTQTASGVKALIE